MTEEIMAELITPNHLIEEMTDEIHGDVNGIMAEVSKKLGIGSYESDGSYDSESGYGSPRSESRDFITMTDVEDNHGDEDAAIDIEHNVDLYFSQPEDLILTQSDPGTNAEHIVIEYQIVEAVKADDLEAFSKQVSEEPEIGEISTITENAEENWKNVSKSDVEKLVEYLKKNSPKPSEPMDNDMNQKSTDEKSEVAEKSEMSEYEMDISESEVISEEEMYEILYQNTTPDHHKYKPLLPDCKNGRACHDELCTSTCTRKKCKLQCNQVVRSWRRREQNKRNSSGFQKRNILHLQKLQKQKNQIKIELETNQKLNRKLKDEISLIKQKLSEIKQSKSVTIA